MTSAVWTSTPEVVALLDSGRIHIFEPGLEDLVSRNRQEGRLRFTTSLADGLDDAEFAFITVGTPSRPDGSCDLSFVEGVARQIGEHMAWAAHRRGQVHRARRDRRPCPRACRRRPRRTWRGHCLRCGVEPRVPQGRRRGFGFHEARPGHRRYVFRKDGLRPCATSTLPLPGAAKSSSS